MSAILTPFSVMAGDDTAPVLLVKFIIAELVYLSWIVKQPLFPGFVFIS